MKNLLLILALFVGNSFSLAICYTDYCDSKSDYYIPPMNELNNMNFSEVKVGDVIFKEIVKKKSLFLNIPEGTFFKQAHYARRCEIEVQDKKSPFKYGTLEGAFGQTKVYMCADLKVKNVDTREKCKGLAELFRNRICFANNYKNSDLNKENPLLRRHLGYMEFSEEKFKSNKHNLSFSKESKNIVVNTYSITYLDENRVEITQQDEVNNLTYKANLDISGGVEGVLKISTYDEKDEKDQRNVYGRKFTFLKKENGFFYKAFKYSNSEALLDRQKEEEERYYAKLTRRCIDFGYQDENAIKACVNQEKFNEKRNEEALARQKRQLLSQQSEIASLQQELADSKSESFWNGVWQQAFSNYTLKKMNNAFKNKINNLENKLRREQRLNRKQRQIRSKSNEYKQLEPIKYSN